MMIKVKTKSHFRGTANGEQTHEEIMGMFTNYLNGISEADAARKGFNKGYCMKQLVRYYKYTCQLASQKPCELKITLKPYRVYITPLIIHCLNKIIKELTELTDHVRTGKHSTAYLNRINEEVFEIFKDPICYYDREDNPMTATEATDSIEHWGVVMGLQFQLDSLRHTIEMLHELGDTSTFWYALLYGKKKN